MSNINFSVNEAESGKRLDLFLTLKIPQFSRSYIKTFINEDKVRVNGEIEFHPQYRVKRGDSISVNAPKRDIRVTDVIKPTKGAIRVIHEDDSILAINKDIWVVVHPAAGHYEDTLANFVKYYLQNKGEDVWDSERVGLVHRLDAATSGLILFAKKPEALWHLAKQFAERRVKKQYLAVVKGTIRDSFKVDSPIGRDVANRKKMSSRTRKPRASMTEFKPLLMNSQGTHTLLRVMPHTGRTHQIRVHLTENGLPIVGDGIYGGQKYSRLMLHAHRLTLRLSPDDSGEAPTLVADPQRDFFDALEDLGFDVDRVRIKIR